MKNWKTVSLYLLTIIVVLCAWASAVSADEDSGYDLTSELWAKAILQVAGDPVILVWKEVGTDITPSGAQVVSGYFYADPADFAYGSVYNPEVFVKVYIDPGGWTNIAFNHVTVDDVDIYSAHGYAGSSDQTDTITLKNRLTEHQYNGVGIDSNLAESTFKNAYPSIFNTSSISPLSSVDGYPLAAQLWAKAILQVSNNPVTLIWKEVGADTTPSGDRVVSGYFYADPNDFAYGSIYNPEIFVKVYIASNGWANIAFNHVTVDDVGVDTAHQYTGTPAQSGIVSLNSRLAEHEYTGVTIPVDPDTDEQEVCFVDKDWKLYYKWENMPSFGSCDLRFQSGGTLISDCLFVNPKTGTWSLMEDQEDGTWHILWGWDVEPDIHIQAPVYDSGSCMAISGVMQNLTAADDRNEGEWYLDLP